MDGHEDGHEERSEFIRGPKWRIRTSPRRRGTAAVTTFVTVTVVGLFAMVLMIGLLQWLGSPTWLVVAPWLVPTFGAVIWVLRKPTPAIATNDDESWAMYSIRYVLVGPDAARPAPTRLIAAVVLGAPVAWSLTILGLLALAGFGS